MSSFTDHLAKYTSPMTKYVLPRLPGPSLPHAQLTQHQATVLLLVPYNTKEDEIHVSSFSPRGWTSF